MTTTETPTLAEFLLARIAEDEAVAYAGFAEDFGEDEWTPARVLAECEAKRRIVEGLAAGMSEEDIMDGFEHEGWEAATRLTLKALALPHADHPDYDESWRP